jgi:arylsulfatase A-like enzyme
VRRPAGEVAGIAASWIGSHADRPMLVWVHLDGRDGIGAVDAAVARLVAAVEDAGLAARTLVVVAGTTGPDGPGGAGLPERRLRVPLVVVAPGLLPRVPEVPHAVRLTDVTATVLAWCALERPGALEGVDLLAYLQGRRTEPLWTVIVGRVDGRWRLGLRQDAVKAVLDVDGDELALFDLAADPEEARDVAPDQPEAARAARERLAGEVDRLRRVEAASPPLGPARAALLRAVEAP